MYTRLKSIYGEEGLRRLQNAKVGVAGLGGVGSYCATALCRSGVGHLSLADFDTIEKSNINRQLFALNSTLGKQKTEVARQLLVDINPDVDIKIFSEKITDNNVEKIFCDVDYIIDCVDDVQAKISLALYAQRADKQIISCMGTALRKDASALHFADLFETSMCPLCKVMRHEARKNKIVRLEVLFSTESPVETVGGKLGSTSYLPPIAGMMLAGKVIEKIADDSGKSQTNHSGYMR